MSRSREQAPRSVFDSVSALAQGSADQLERSGNLFSTLYNSDIGRSDPQRQEYNEFFADDNALSIVRKEAIEFWTGVLTACDGCAMVSQFIPLLVTGR